MGIAFEEVCKVEFAAMIAMFIQVAIYGTADFMTEELREWLLPASSAGKEFACFASTEPDCGSDAAAIRARAVRDGNWYILSGEKTSISGGMQADGAFLTAKTNPQAGVRGVRLFYVRRWHHGDHENDHCEGNSGPIRLHVKICEEDVSRCHKRAVGPKAKDAGRSSHRNRV
jgi:alkylation response protein AidB-like acyl-CoA dehydrogenase